MKIINRIMIFYFIVVLPLIFLAWIVWPPFTRTELAVGSAFLEWGNAVTGLMFAGWMISAIYIAASLVVSPRFREHLLKRFIRMRERDEREEMIVGRAARNAFLFNLALLILVFTLNLVQIDVTRLAPGHEIDGKKHSLSLGLNASPIVLPQQEDHPPAEENDGTIFRYRFPVTVSGTIMFLIMANVAYFYICTRRTSRQGTA